MNEVKEFLEQKLQDNETVVLALSGGPDSMCLLHLLQQVKKKITIICAHVNHKTRKENQSEYQFVRDYLKKSGITLEYYEILSYQKGRFREAEAREKRYQFFFDVYHKYQAKYLLTAHHADDLIETIIMRMLRGSSLEGYAGILQESTQKEVNLLRPLLRVNKKEIIKYLQKNNLSYVTDVSNESEDYLRNRIRLHILPILQEEKNYVSQFLNYSLTLQEASKLISKRMESIYPLVVEKNQIKKDEFLKLSIEEQNYILRKYFSKNYKNSINKVQDKHIILCRELLKKTHSMISMPLNKEWYVSKSFAKIKNKKSFEDYFIELKERVVLPNQMIVKKISKYEEKSNYEIHLNSKDIKLPLYLTTRKKAMRMEVKNLKGSKKVSDIMIDKKIERENRDEIPILVDSNNTVLWILGVSKSKYDVLKNEKYDIIYKYEKKERRI